MERVRSRERFLSEPLLQPTTLSSKAQATYGAFPFRPWRLGQLRRSREEPRMSSNPKFQDFSSPHPIEPVATPTRPKTVEMAGRCATLPRKFAPSSTTEPPCGRSEAPSLPRLTSNAGYNPHADALHNGSSSSRLPPSYENAMYHRITDAAPPRHRRRYRERVMSRAPMLLSVLLMAIVCLCFGAVAALKRVRVLTELSPCGHRLDTPDVCASDIVGLIRVACFLLRS